MYISRPHWKLQRVHAHPGHQSATLHCHSNRPPLLSSSLSLPPSLFLFVSRSRSLSPTSQLRNSILNFDETSRGTKTASKKKKINRVCKKNTKIIGKIYNIQKKNLNLTFLSGSHKQHVQNYKIISKVFLESGICTKLCTEWKKNR